MDTSPLTAEPRGVCCPDVYTTRPRAEDPGGRVRNPPARAVCIESAEKEPDPEGRKIWLTLCVVGAGPNGVEMAGAFAEIARQTLIGEFRRIDPHHARTH